MKKFSQNWKLMLGLLLSLLFMYLAFRKVDFTQMATAFASANYFYLLPTVAVILFSHWLRAVRWQYLLAPVQKIRVTPLFNSLIIGYLFNIFLPAHLGEFIRAYILARKEPISASAAFGTIVIERIIDVLTMLLLMAVAMIVYPFPPWVKNSGFLAFILIVGLFILLIVMKTNSTAALNLVRRMTSPLKASPAEKINHFVQSFLQGIVPLKNKSHYFMVTLLSILLWVCYGYIFQLVLNAFDFINIYSLPWTTSLVLLVITTFSILVPSSPGYVGTYHYLCQLSLGLFGVPASPALTFAFVMHGVSFIPVLVLGLIILSKEGLSISGLQKSAGTKH
jgi:glycosyltransferase 2 family protein